MYDAKRNVCVRMTSNAHHCILWTLIDDITQGSYSYPATIKLCIAGPLSCMEYCAGMQYKTQPKLCQFWSPIIPNVKGAL